MLPNNVTELFTDEQSEVLDFATVEEKANIEALQLAAIEAHDEAAKVAAALYELEAERSNRVIRQRQDQRRLAAIALGEDVPDKVAQPRTENLVATIESVRLRHADAAETALRADGGYKLAYNQLLQTICHERLGPRFVAQMQEGVRTYLMMKAIDRTTPIKLMPPELDVGFMIPALPFVAGPTKAHFSKNVIFTPMTFNTELNGEVEKLKLDIQDWLKENPNAKY